jgi:hypothetical protein
MFEFARKNFFEAGDEKFQKYCLFSCKKFSYNALFLELFISSSFNGIFPGKSEYAISFYVEKPTKQ